MKYIGLNISIYLTLEEAELIKEAVQTLHILKTVDPDRKLSALETLALEVVKESNLLQRI